MPEVFKNPAVEALDDLFSGESAETYRTVRELLESDENLFDLTRRYVRRDRRWSEDDLSHFRSHWLERHGNVAQLMKQRYREAVDEAMNAGEEAPLPIDTYWVRDGTDEFEMQVLTGKRRVAVHVFLPEGFDPIAGK